MSSKNIMGLALLIVGLVLTYLAFYTSDSLGLLQSSVLHFLEHMRMLWSLMSPLSRVALIAGALGILIGLILLLRSSRRSYSNEFH